MLDQDLDYERRLANLDEESFAVVMLGTSAVKRKDIRLFEAINQISKTKPTNAGGEPYPDDLRLIERIRIICDEIEAKYWGRALGCAIERGDNRRIGMLYSCMRIRTSN